MKKTFTPENRRDGFLTTGAMIWLQDNLPARDVFHASEPSRLDGTPARFALESPTYPDIFAYCDIRVTGRKWRPEYSGSQSWRLTVQVTFKDSGETVAGEILVTDWSDRAATLDRLGLMTAKLEEISK